MDMDEKDYYEPSSQRAVDPSLMGMGLPPTDNPTEFTKFVLDPQARELYKHITKDLAVSNLDNSEMEYVNANLRLLHMVIYIEEKLGDLEDLKHVILQDIYSFMQVTRSKGGFERLAEITKAMKSYQQYTENKEKKRWL